ncbi:MAG: M50 family metallopeptidase [Verrucomicrobiota bacterium]
MAPTTVGDGPTRPVIGILVGVLLIPILGTIILTVGHAFVTILLRHGFWRSAEFWYFLQGTLMWAVCFFGLPQRPLRVLYVFAHEWTHALFAFLSGGRLLRRPSVTSQGGQIVTTKDNLLIRLSPYVFPFYSVLAGLLFAVANVFLTFSTPLLWSLYAVLGFTWSFHLTFTAWVVRTRQPDLDRSGRFFSLVLIALINLLTLTLLLTIASPDLTFRSLIDLWQERVGALLTVFP